MSTRQTHSLPLVTIALFWSASVFAGMDDASLKERLVEYYFYAGHDSVWQEFDTFKKQNAVSDEQLHRVLMAVYRETGDNRPALTPQSDEWKRNQGIAESVVRWLPKCGNVPVKDFLLDHMTAKEADGHIRQQAILAYLRVADAEEAKDVLLRFLVGEDRMDDYARSSIYRYPSVVWDAASPEKKAAMFNALCEAAAVETTQWAFEECDSQLIAMYPAYRDSLQRKAMLRRQLSAPFSHYYTELKDKMGKEVKRLEKMEKHANTSSNLATLTAQNFSISQADQLTSNNASEHVPVNAGDESEPPATPLSRSLRTAVPLAVGAGLLAAFFLWRGLRKKKS